MMWFGEKPWCMACAGCPHARTPVGERCLWCDEEIADVDSGFLIPHMETTWDVLSGPRCSATLRPWHAECHIRQIAGPLAHQKGLCPCFGGKGDDEDKGLTRREAARRAAAFASGRVEIH